MVCIHTEINGVAQISVSMPGTNLTCLYHSYRNRWTSIAVAAVLVEFFLARYGLL